MPPTKHKTPAAKSDAGQPSAPSSGKRPAPGATARGEVSKLRQAADKVVSDVGPVLEAVGKLGDDIVPLMATAKESIKKVTSRKAKPVKATDAKKSLAKKAGDTKKVVTKKAGATKKAAAVEKTAVAKTVAKKVKSAKKSIAKKTATAKKAATAKKPTAAKRTS
jgi:hypothetical protein